MDNLFCGDAHIRGRERESRGYTADAFNGQCEGAAAGALLSGICAMER